MKSSQSTYFFSYWYSRSATETVNVQVTIIWKVKLVSTYLKDTPCMSCWIIFSFLPSALYFSMESKYIYVNINTCSTLSEQSCLESDQICFFCTLDKIYLCFQIQGRVQDFLKEAPTTKGEANLIFGQMFPETA